MPGVSSVNTGAADPNVTSSIQIRGVNSRQAGLGPAHRNRRRSRWQPSKREPRDIASFDVLKDGAASAIYGTRGTNGVTSCHNQERQQRR
ncbi:MAG: TonB-dependent receptor plug domain-containing protein [Alistipes communis]